MCSMSCLLEFIRITLFKNLHGTDFILCFYRFIFLVQIYVYVLWIACFGKYTVYTYFAINASNLSRNKVSKFLSNILSSIARTTNAFACPKMLLQYLLIAVVDLKYHGPPAGMQTITELHILLNYKGIFIQASPSLHTR